MNEKLIIEDIPENWDEPEVTKGGKLSQRCKLYPSLFKVTDLEGNVKFVDYDRYYCTEIKKPWQKFHIRPVKDLIHKLYPITMPYIPEDNSPIEVVVESTYKVNDGKLYGLLRVDSIYFELGKKTPCEAYFKTVPFGWKEIKKVEYDLLKVSMKIVYTS